MEAAWTPSEWYPSDLYGERLSARDKLEQLRSQLPRKVTALLKNALYPLDVLFADLTVDDTDGLLGKELLPGKDAATAHGWWWNRRRNPCPGETRDRCGTARPAGSHGLGRSSVQPR